ncbi:pyruvate kinase [Pasteurella canis]|uniref:pyruvate kinase n=1 Tax=Pasteurella canis TaxID=753 RepID=UPI001E657925|nr:pyruvate kinase [Pasteurella canis]
MKAFDLEKALAGEPVRLRDGSKAFVMFRKPEKLVFTHDTELVGYVISGIHAVTQSWSINGLHQENEESDADIVGMWEEPRPTVTLTLPCPLKDVAIGDEIYILSGYSYQNNGVPEVLVRKHNNSTEFFNAINFGLAFKTKEDAEAWLEALKNSRR